MSWRRSGLEMLQTVITGVLIIVIAAAVVAIARAVTQYAGKAGVTSGAARWIAENWSWARNGFRLQAVLEADHATSTARAIISKVPAQMPDTDSTIARIEDVRFSAPFQSHLSFARRLYATWIPNAAYGFARLEVHGCKVPDSWLMPGQTVWTVQFDSNPSATANDGCRAGCQAVSVASIA
jgi:hypothetical protein